MPASSPQDAAGEGANASAAYPARFTKMRPGVCGFFWKSGGDAAHEKHDLIENVDDQFGRSIVNTAVQQAIKSSSLAAVEARNPRRNRRLHIPQESTSLKAGKRIPRGTQLQSSSVIFKIWRLRAQSESQVRFRCLRVSNASQPKLCWWTQFDRIICFGRNARYYQ